MKENVTIFLCTHQLRYAQEICTRYGLIEEGRLLAAGTLDELRRSVSPRIHCKGQSSRISSDLISLLHLRKSEREDREAAGSREICLETEVSSEKEIPL